MAWPPEAAPSLTTARGENVLWPERLSSSTFKLGPGAPLELLLEVLVLLDEELLEVPPCESRRKMVPALIFAR
jgi:hypothetical protein